MIKIKPILYLHLEIPYVCVSTSIMRDCFEQEVIEYIMLYVSIHKWKFKIRLYNTKEIK